MRTLLLVVALLGSTAAAAEPAPTPAPKSPVTALWLSLGTSAAGLGLVLVGADAGIRPQAYGQARGIELPLAAVGGAALLVGPSLGSAYAGRFWNGGTALRLAGVGIGAAGLALAVQPSRGPEGALNVGPYFLLGGGAAVYLAGAVYEIATTPRAVRRYNRRTLELSLSPAPLATPGGRIAPGLALAGRF